MRFSTLATAATATLVAGQDMSLCSKYTTALLKEDNAKNEMALLTILVNTVVIGNYSESKTGMKVPGILAKGNVDGKEVNLAPYFSGALASTNRNDKAACVNFLDGGAAEPLMKNKPANDEKSNQYFLLTHLYKFFGTALGCPHQDDPAFGKYDGDASMYKVHKFMNLGSAEFNYFVQQVGGAAMSLGVSKEDATAVGKLLTDSFGMKCAPADKNGDLQAICVADGCMEAKGAACDKYAKVAAPSMCPKDTGMMTGTPTPTMSGTQMPTGGASGTMAPTTAPSAAGVANGINMAAAAAGVAALLL